jgi:DNA repair protein RadC
MKSPQPNIAEVCLVYRSKVKASDRPRVKSSRDAFTLFSQSWDLDTLEHIEEFKMMLLNRCNAVLGVLTVSKGGISGTVTDVRVILQAAIKANACGIIVCHNHPSGNLTPSESDIKITSKIKDSASLMDIQLLDHLIINPDDQYYSFADEGTL